MLRLAKQRLKRSKERRLLFDNFRAFGQRFFSQRLRELQLEASFGIACQGRLQTCRVHVIEPAEHVIVDEAVFREFDLRTKLFISKQTLLEPFERWFIRDSAQEILANGLFVV